MRLEHSSSFLMIVGGWLVAGTARARRPSRLCCLRLVMFKFTARCQLEPYYVQSQAGKDRCPDFRK
jgi:hypothetical protein